MRVLSSKYDFAAELGSTAMIELILDLFTSLVGDDLKNRSKLFFNVPRESVSEDLTGAELDATVDSDSLPERFPGGLIVDVEVVLEVFLLEVVEVFLDKCVCAAVLFTNVGPDVAGFIAVAAVSANGLFVKVGFPIFFFLTVVPDCVVGFAVDGFLDEGGGMVVFLPFLGTDITGFFATALEVVAFLEGIGGFVFDADIVDCLIEAVLVDLAKDGRFASLLFVIVPGVAVVDGFLTARDCEAGFLTGVALFLGLVVVVDAFFLTGAVLDNVDLADVVVVDFK